MSLAKLETPSRLRELKPVSTLTRIGFDPGMVMLDVGAGTGVFAIPAAELPAKMVHALDVDDAALDVVCRKAREAHLPNVDAIKIDAGPYDVEDGTVDLALVSCVLHEIDSDARVHAFQEIKRTLADGGRLAVIEFCAGVEGFGPVQDIRISQSDLEAFGREQGYQVLESFNLSENLYCVIFGK